MTRNTTLETQNRTLYRNTRATVSGRMDYLGDVLDTFADLGLALTAYPEVTRRYEYAKTLGAATTTARTYEAEQKRLTADLATGTITVETAVERAVAAELRAKKDGMAAQVVRSARSQVLASVWTALDKAGDGIVTGVLRPAVEEIVDEAVILTAIIEDISDDSAAIAGTTEQTAAWVHLGALVGRWHAIHDLADTLRSLAAIPTSNLDATGGPYFQPVTYRYANLDAVPQDPGYAPLVLADAIRRDARPTILTQAEADAIADPTAETVPSEPGPAAADTGVWV